MRLILLALSCILLGVSSGGPRDSGNGAEPSLAVTVGGEIPVDQVFEERIQSAWAELRRLLPEGTAARTEAERRYAVEFFEYHLAHQDTPTGLHAGRSAFLIWANMGNVDDVEAAAAQLPYGSPVWRHAVLTMEPIYHREHRQGEYIVRLHRLERKLASPPGRSALFSQLGSHYLDTKNEGKCREYIERIIELDADPDDVRWAEGVLHQLDWLGIGQQAPDFEAETIDGKTFRLSSARDRVVVIEFWAMWCSPCRPEIPHLRGIDREHQRLDVQIIGISFDEDRKRLAAFVEDNTMGWAQILEPKGWDSELARLYSVNRIPRSIIVDRDGSIVAKDLRGSELEEFVRRLLAKPAAPAPIG